MRESIFLETGSIVISSTKEGIEVNKVKIDFLNIMFGMNFKLILSISLTFIISIVFLEISELYLGLLFLIISNALILYLKIKTDKLNTGVYGTNDQKLLTIPYNYSDFDKFALALWKEYLTEIYANEFEKEKLSIDKKDFYRNIPFTNNYIFVKIKSQNYINPLPDLKNRYYESSLDKLKLVDEMIQFLSKSLRILKGQDYDINYNYYNFRGTYFLTIE